MQSVRSGAQPDNEWDGVDWTVAFAKISFIRVGDATVLPVAGNREQAKTF